MTDEKRLFALVQSIIARREDRIEVSPSWVATEAMLDLDPDRTTVPLVYIAAHLQFRQISRKILGEKNDDKSDDNQHKLWPDLQRRYPKAHTLENDEPVYVLLEHLTDEDVEYNIDRLRKEAESKLRHARALEAWWKDRPANVA